MRKLYGFIVGKCKVDPEYFFDSMTFPEIESLISAYEDEFRDGWEKTRTISHAIISSQSSKPISPEEVLKFDWDTDTKKVNSGMSDEDRERLMKKHKKQ